MDYSKIIAVSGKPGLFNAISETKNGFVVEGLLDKKRFHLTANSSVSLIENIAIYTYEEEVPILVVFKAIYHRENGGKTLSHKESGKKLNEYFLEILPSFDEERVYTSNIKKVIQWYNILVDAGMDFSKIEASDDNTQEVE